MHFCPLSRNSIFKVDLDRHLRNKHGNLFFMRFGVILALVQGWSNQGWKMHFWWLSWNWNFKVDLDTHLRDKHWWKTDLGIPINSWTCGLWDHIYSPSISNIIGNWKNTQRYQNSTSYWNLIFLSLYKLSKYKVVTQSLILQIVKPTFSNFGSRTHEHKQLFHN